jgi:hypothetical protein
MKQSRSGLITWLCLASTLLIASSHAEQVVISEIMYHPPGSIPEFIEVQNATATPFDMAEWRLRDGVDFDFPAFNAADPAQTFLKPFERILLTSADPATLRSAYAVPAGIRVLGPWSGSLDNAGERITLKDKNGVVLCTVAYTDRGRWPVAADGAGHTLVLLNPDRRIDDVRNWTASSKRLGTPGTEPVAVPEFPVPSPEVNLNEGIPFVNYGDTWRFHDQNIDLLTAWRSADYDDSSWTQGPGLFGFESAPLPSPGIRTPFADLDQLTYYARTRFTYNGSLTGVTLSIDQILDDGAVYYLNGTQLGRSGMPGGAIGFSTPANRTVGDAAEEPNVITVPGTALRQGENVLAVEVHQVGAGSSDIVFGARLKISTPSQPSLILNEVLPGPAGTGFIEIYNPRGTNISLRSHHLTDDPGNLAKFRINADIVVPPSGLVSLGFAESGFAVQSPVRVYLVAPDGQTILNAIDAAMPLDGRSLGRKPAGGASWFLFADPTRNSPNASLSALAALVRLNEVHFSPTNTLDWVELHNTSSTAVSVDGLFLASRSDLTDRVPLTGSVPAAGFLSRDSAFRLSDGEVTVYLVNASNTVLGAQVFQRPQAGDTFQAFPNGANEWYATPSSTRNGPNAPVRQTDLVINEVMYDAPSDEPSAEFVELYNRGTTTVDLSGWRFSDGIGFTFPAGTRIAPDAYLVVAADASVLQQVYGGIPVIGNFEGRLANNGERIRLLDALGNLADEVEYSPGGNWPRLANGDGASMELRNPWMDNALASAWQDSNETNKSVFQTYRYSAPYQELRTGGATTDYKELHLHLVGDSHVVLRNIQLRLNGGGANLLANSTRMSADGFSAGGWLAQGTHFATRFLGAEMHLIADGHGDNRPNRVELDATALTRSSTYEVSFEARWVAGASRLIVQTWDHSIATDISLAVPRNLGTPGARNSRHIPLPAAQVDRILHSPPVPSPGQPVRITAHITSFAPAPQVVLHHRLDEVTGGGAWTPRAMSDDGVSGGDEVAGDGIYTTQLTEYTASGQIAQFYVVATANGQSTQLPPRGPEKPALFLIDNPSQLTDLRRMRFIVPSLAIADLAGGDGPTPPNGHAFPRLSNHYYNMTLIINEREIVYDCEIRNGGSPWTRGNDLSRGKFKVPKDQLFRGKEKLTYDNDAGGGSRHHNRISRHWLYLLGHPANENEFIQVNVNNGGSSLREEVEPLGNDMLDRIYPDGNQGELYRIDDEWWFNDDWGRGQRDADWSYKGSDNPGRYHSEWMKRTRENEYDYSALIGMFRKVTSTYTQAEIEQVLDPVAIMQMAAVRGYIGDWDSFTLNRGKNGYLYRRPTDGRFMFFHWDSDLAFQNTGEAFYNGMQGYRAWHERSYNQRLFRHFLITLVENYAQNSARMNAWLKAEEDASTQYTVSTDYQNWFSGRQSPAYSAVGPARTALFDITTNGGQPLNVTSNTLNLTGTGPLRVFRVEAPGHPNSGAFWTTDSTWTITNLTLRTGANLITVQGLDFDGRVLVTDTITVNKTGNAPPIMTLESSPGSLHVSVLDSLKLDASRSYDPDAQPLAFSWSANPADTQLDTRGVNNATAYFSRPGIYTFTVNATDSGGATNSILRQAAVFGPNGFSPFTEPALEGFWNLENVSQRDNHFSAPYYSTTEVPGMLTLQVLADRSRPLAPAPRVYPYLWRTVPPLTDWMFLTEVSLNTRVFGDYITGAMVEIDESGTLVRYAMGVEDGTALNVRRITETGTSTLLRGTPATRARADIRIRRDANSLVFEHKLNNVWSVVHSAGLPAGATARKAGLFLATDTAQRIKATFDYAMLIDPSSTSDLRESLRISEIMYNPPGGTEYEFVELLNIGDSALDLTGVRFTEGIDYAFGPTTLGAKEHLVVVKNQALFASRYSTAGMKIAPGIFLGRLDNAGERISLADSNGVVFLSVDYGTTPPWPPEPDGAGQSLESRDPAGNPADPSNWRASPEAGGSPGRAGGDALGTVIINEALAHTDPPLEDAIEVHNRTAQPVNIGGWFLSDSAADFKKWRIPNGTLVPAYGHRVFYEIDFNTNNLVSPFSLSSANGDQVYLSAADAAGNLTGYRSAVSFDASANGVSFGRYDTSIGRDFPPLVTRTFGVGAPTTVEQFRTGQGQPNAAPLTGPVVIQEIMYRPLPIGGTNDNTADEFVEIHNLTDSSVNLFDPAYPTNTWRLRGGADFDFPTGFNLPAHGYALIVRFNPLTNAPALTAFRTRYGLPADVRVLGPYAGQLNNRTEELKLTRPDAPTLIGPTAGEVPYLLVDRVVYSDAYPWPAGADGVGGSLQRRRPHEYGNDPVNWKAADPTPGRANVQGSSFTDTDRDGLPDSFETTNGFSNANAADAAQDADADNRSNYEEFLDGTDPRSAASRLVRPSVTSGPAIQFGPGGAATLSVSADGSGPLRYQWRVNGVLIPNATNATHLIPDAQASQAGEYSVVVHNTAGFVLSPGVLLNVSQPLVVIEQPRSLSATRGGSVTFAVTAAGTGTLRYQWRFNSQPIAGATNSSFTLHPVQSGDAGNYSVSVFDDNTSLASAEATLTVLSPPVITSQPASQSQLANTPAVFTVTAEGDEPITYQWRFGANAIPGATDSVLSLPSVQPSQAGTYRVEVTNPNGSTLSAEAVLTVRVPAIITQQPADTNAIAGTLVIFRVQATSSSTIRYQWRFNDADIPAATNASLTVGPVGPSNEGNYRVELADAEGSIQSAIAVLTVINPLALLQAPVGQTAVQGGSVTLSAEWAGGPHPFHVEWFRNDASIGSATINETRAFLRLDNLQPADTAGYRLEIRSVPNPAARLAPAAAEVTVLVDTDDDGMPDVWEEAFSFNRNNSGDAVQDEDEDRMPNRSEYEAGTHPRDARDRLLLNGLLDPTGMNLWFDAVSNRTYTVEFSDTLGAGNWFKLEDWVARSTNTLNSIKDLEPASRRQYRVLTPRRP